MRSIGFARSAYAQLFEHKRKRIATTLTSSRLYLMSKQGMFSDVHSTGVREQSIP